MPGKLSRRGLLIGGGASLVALAAGATELVNAGVLPGQIRLHRMLGACDVGGPLPQVTPGPIEHGTFRSAARRRTVGFAIVHPPGARANADVPVCLYLHGLGGDHRDVSTARIGLPWVLADRVRAGARPIALVGVDGGSGYWHRRASGDDPGRMLFDELLPLLAARGFPTRRIGLLGASMGGYGALLWGERMGPARVVAVGAMSPALWLRYSDSAPGAFDSEADFAAHDVFTGSGRLGRTRVHIDCGRDDPFASATRAFLARAPTRTTGTISAGCHDAAFWRTAAYSQLTRLSRALA